MSYLSKYLDEHTTALIKYKGLLLFIEGKVSFSSCQKNFAEFAVLENWEYTVDLFFNEHREPVKVVCECSKYTSQLCRHSAASLYFLNSHKYFQEDGPSLDEILNKTGTERTILAKKSFDPEEMIVPASKIDPEYTRIVKVMREIEERSKPATPKIIEKLKKKKESEKKSEVDPVTRVKDKLNELIVPERKSKSKQNKRFAYGLSTGYSSSSLTPVWVELDRNGEIKRSGRVYSVDQSEMESISFEDKIILNFLVKSGGELSVDLFANLTGERYKRNRNASYLLSELIEKYLGSRDLFYGGQDNLDLTHKVAVLQQSAKAIIRIDTDKKNINLSLEIKADGKKLKKLSEFELFLPEPLWIWNKNELIKVDNLTREQYEFFKDNNFTFSFPKLLQEFFEKDILSQLLKTIEIESKLYKVEKLSVPPVKLLYLEESEGKLMLRLRFRYKDDVIDFGNGREVEGLLKEGLFIQIIRDTISEENARAEIKECYVREVEPGVFNPRNDPLTFLFTYLDTIKEKGFEIYGEAELNKFKITTHTPSLSVTVSSGIDWFDVTADINIGDAQVSLGALFDSIKQRKTFIKLSDGSNARLTKEWLDKFERIFSFAEIKDNTVRFSNTQAVFVEELISEVDEVVVDSAFREHTAKLKNFTRINKTPIPERIESKLREYQKLGFDWFYFLKEFRFGGILADDMGLGKTIQVLALLLREKQMRTSLPTLIVAPTSVVFNWINEAEKFTPELKILDHTGVDRIKESTIHFEDYDCIITSYGILLRDEDIFTQRDFHYVILDESQRIKNPLAKTSRIVRKLHANHRLCLTGTPVENNLTELWSQFAFLNQGMFGSLGTFKDSLVKPIQKDFDSNAADYLKKVIYPFILRRTKDLVAKELPPKTEIVHYCEMDDEQARLYEIWKNSIRNEVMSQIDRQGLRKSRFKIIEGLLRLRQICNHPQLLKNVTVKKSGKFEEFKDLTHKVIEEDHKVLVFSQFVKMLDIIEAYLKRVGMKYVVLTGKSMNREEIVERFQNDPKIKIFLISLKAGGFGLNLTAADYVFHYDPWWNPAVEMQATDRTHRIGQDKNVFVYKFITKNSVEEKILQLQEKKRELVSNIVSTDSSIFKSLERDDIEILFS
ncbi:MAG: DEAD/DEAH box helicase [Ignavibacteriaceae bacterium]|nr:DEAD/DEAH box helicase [Ignavibacteriaceae bacterium]